MKPFSIRMSGSDIAVIVRDALMQPIRKVQLATHFKEVLPYLYDVTQSHSHLIQVMAPCRDDPATTKRYLTPCSPGDTGAKEMDWSCLEGDELLEPDLTLADFVRAVQNGRKSVNEEDVGRYTQWTAEFGQEG